MFVEKEDMVVVYGWLVKLVVLGLGKIFYVNVWMKGCYCDIFVGNNFISMYGRCGSVDDV